jgi:hypothetical protein
MAVMAPLPPRTHTPDTGGGTDDHRHPEKPQKRSIKRNKPVKREKRRRLHPPSPNPVHARGETPEEETQEAERTRKRIKKG